MDEDPPPPTDQGTPEEAVPSAGETSPPTDTTPSDAGAAASGQDATASDAGSAVANGKDSTHLIDQLHHLSSFDTACLVVFCMSLLWGLMRGGSRELSGIMVWVGALWLALRTSNAVLAWADPSLPESLQDSGVALWGARIVIFIIAVVILSTLVDRISYIARSNLSRGLDTLLGFVFGAIRGYALLVAFCLVSSWVSVDWITSVSQDSVMMPYITKGMQILQGYVPPSLQSYLALPDTNTLQDTNSQ